MSFKRHCHCGNPSLFSGATAVQSWPKSHTFTVNSGMFAPPPPPPSQDGVKNRWKGLFITNFYRFISRSFNCQHYSVVLNKELRTFSFGVYRVCKEHACDKVVIFSTSGALKNCQRSGFQTIHLKLCVISDVTKPHITSKHGGKKHG